MDVANLIEIFSPQGVWAVLSLVLLFYIIKRQDQRDIKQDEREKKYQTVITDLSLALKDLNEIKAMLLTKI